MAAMDGVLRFAIDMILGRGGAAGVVAATRRTAMAALPMTVAALCAMAAFGCVVAALWLFALPYVGPAGAALCAAGLLLAGALAMALLAKSLTRPEPRPAPPPIAADALIAEAMRVFRDHKGAVFAAALVAGLCAGNDPGAGRR